MIVWWSSTAPLEMPVVPPVYCSTAMSSGRMSGFFNACPRPLATAALKRTAPGSEKAGTAFFTRRRTKSTIAPFGKPRSSPTLARITCLTGVSAMTFCSVCAKFSSMMIALAPESLSWCESSRAVYSGLTLTTMKPALRIAATATGYCRRFGIWMATRSLRSSPSPCR